MEFVYLSLTQYPPRCLLECQAKPGTNVHIFRWGGIIGIWQHVTSENETDQRCHSLSSWVDVVQTDFVVAHHGYRWYYLVAPTRCHDISVVQNRAQLSQPSAVCGAAHMNSYLNESVLFARLFANVCDQTNTYGHLDRARWANMLRSTYIFMRDIFDLIYRK